MSSKFSENSASSCGVESRPLVLDAEHKESTAVARAFHTHTTMPPRRANANANTRKLNQQLQTAVVANDEAGVRKAVERGADMNAVMASGYAVENVPPLFHPVAQGNTAMVRVLAELGAQVDAQDPALGGPGAGRSGAVVWRRGQGPGRRSQRRS